MSDLNEQLRECAHCGKTEPVRICHASEDENFDPAENEETFAVVCDASSLLGEGPGGCGSQGGFRKIKAEAVALWNLRAMPAPQAAPSDTRQPMIGRLLDEFSILPVLWGLNEPGALMRHSDVFKMLVAVGKEYAAAPAVAITQAATSEPVSDFDAQAQQAWAWFQCVDALNDVARGWQKADEQGGKAAAATIRKLAHLAGTTPNTEAPSDGGKALKAMVDKGLEAIASAEPVPAVMKTWPEDIWLNTGEDDELAPFGDYSEVSWCDHPTNSVDVRYVREDVAARAAAWHGAALSAQQAGVQEAPSEDAKDAARYRFLRNPQTDVALVIDKRTGWVPPDENFPGIGGYYAYEYRAGEELDAAIDQARAALAAATQTEKP